MSQEKRRNMIETATSNIFNYLNIEPTTSQSKALYEIENFLDDKVEQIFILKGSAGTGKTTLTKVLVDYLLAKNESFHLLSSTAKAASILSNKTGHIGHTIHHLIYTPVTLEDGRVKFNYKPNESDTDTIFIIDEASMIPAQKASSGDFISNNPLLMDLLRFVFNGKNNNQIIFLGDDYQLKPVNEDSSMALCPQGLSKAFNVKCKEVTLKEVVRQASHSPVLSLAIQVKEAKDNSKSTYSIKPRRLANESDAISYYSTYFNPNHLDEIMFIGKSNEQVEHLNQLVRARLGFSELLEVGDVVMLRNNLQKEQHTFVNGGIGIIKSLSTDVKEIAGLRFKNASIEFQDSQRNVIVETKIFLDSLSNNMAKLNSESLRYLKNDRMKHNGTFRQSERITDDPYMSAMKLSYAYAMTCHKAQGSEWKRVLYTSEKLIATDHAWLYTAVTRAKNEVLTWWF